MDTAVTGGKSAAETVLADNANAPAARRLLPVVACVIEYFLVDWHHIVSRYWIGRIYLRVARACIALVISIFDKVETALF
jgi:hypothetical protein